MKEISALKIKNVVSELCLKANFVLRDDVLASLKSVLRQESGKKTRDILRAIIENARIAKSEKLAICQDTGLPVVFVEIGQDLKISGDLKKAINEGVKAGYNKGSLRPSVIKDPLERGKSGCHSAYIHMDMVKGNKLKLTVLPKGFGCENKVQLKMFNPTAGLGEIKKFIIDTVKSAGPDACPPYIVGVGIGGTADGACFLAKKALLNRINRPKGKLERELLKEINKLRIGAMGLGGNVTALAVNIIKHPTHIAGMPVAVNISCHALRSATASL